MPISVQSVHANPEQIVGAKPDLILFGAGPLPRGSGVSHHQELIDQILVAQEAGLLPANIVYITPERMGDALVDYTDQLEAEQFWLARADAILAWSARDMTANMPGLTTNFEVGERFKLPWFFLGGPEGEESVRRNRYLRRRWEGLGRPWADSLGEMVAQLAKWWSRQEAEQNFEFRHERNFECNIPIQLRLTADYWQWASRVLAAGNRVTDFEVIWAYGVGPGQRFLFSWNAQVAVYVTAEKRTKSNEYVSSRRTYSTTVLYCDECGDRRVLFAGEFRSPQGDIYWALPAGSTFKVGKTPLETAVEELFEETGVMLEPELFKPLGNLTPCALISGVETTVWAVRISRDAMDEIEAAVDGKTFGVIEDTEITYPRVFELDNLPASVDFTTLGILWKVFHQ